MQKKYAYTHNGIWTFLKGFLPLARGSKPVHPHLNQSTVFVWRNHVIDGYKIGYGYSHQPMDLSNYLLIRTRERFLLNSRVSVPHIALRSGKPGYFSGPTSEASLKEAEKDLQEKLVVLERHLAFLDPVK